MESGVHIHEPKEGGTLLYAYVCTGTARNHSHDQERERNIPRSTFNKKGREKKYK